MPLSEYRDLRKPLMRATAYDVLRDAIIRGELAPGEPIKDTELAAQLGLSRTPVREALARLAEAGLVESKPGAFTRVTRLDRRDVEGMLAVLRTLHSLAVSTAVPHLTEHHLQELRDANGRLADAVERHEIGDALAADDSFHKVIVEASDNPVLERLLDQLHPMLHRILFREFSTLLGGRDTVEHHARLIELCERKDAPEAAEFSAAHWSRLGGLIGKLFDEDFADR